MIICMRLDPLQDHLQVTGVTGVTGMKVNMICEAVEVILRVQ